MVNRQELKNYSDVDLMDLYLLCKEELEIRSNRRKTSLGKLSNNMLIEEAENLIGIKDYEKYIREGIIYEVGDRVRLI